ncbi:MAG: sugar phosphate isomerase/epimerase [Clostridia bacterium]|nr:sugar phosphate isomerase/epimerase [Clostridia bacterium]
MEIGINLQRSVDLKTQVKLLHRLGIRHTFFSSDWELLPDAVELCREHGITVDTLHAPFDGINDIWRPDESGDKMLERLIGAVDKCRDNGIPIAVVHLSSGKPMPEITEQGIHRFERLFAYAEEKVVKIALENQRFLENLSFFLDRYPKIGFCWDVGHEYGFTKGIRFMKLYGDRAVTTHVHDNRCGVDTDDHLIPFDGKIDYKTVAENLATSPYNGTLMLELKRFPKAKSGVSYESYSDKRFFRRARRSAKKLIRMTIKIKNKYKEV